MKLTITEDLQLQKDGEYRRWPALSLLRPYLPKATSRRAPGIRSEIACGRFTKEEALRAIYSYEWTRDKIRDTGSGEVTLESADPGSVYLAMGETMYALHPVKSIGTTRALKLARKQALSVAKAEASAVLEVANSEAGNMRAEARRTVDQAQQLIHEYNQIDRGSRSGASIGSLEILGEGRHGDIWRTLGHHGGYETYVRVPVPGRRVSIHSWSFGGITLPLNHEFHGAFSVDMNYVWRNGRWELQPAACRLSRKRPGPTIPSPGYGELPHITFGSACFTLGSAIESPKTYGDVANHATLMMNTQGVVNFSSLLSHSPGRWPTNLVSCFPEGFVISNEAYEGGYMMDMDKISEVIRQHREAGAEGESGTCGEEFSIRGMRDATGA